MINFDYYLLYKKSKDFSFMRAEIIKSAKTKGIKPTAKQFNTTIKTVKKWLKRYNENPKTSLNDKSKRPIKSPNEMDKYYQYKIIQVCKDFQTKNKRINAVKIKELWNIPYSVPSILKVMRKNGFIKLNKKKKERKKDLREYKKKYKPFEKIQIDVKYLDDIPEMYKEFIKHNLPRYQYTARCIRTGALFISFAREKSISNSVVFLTELLKHLKKYNVDLKNVKIQTDNGKEFTNGYFARKSDFTKIIEEFCRVHRLIPPGAKTWQSDVETSHRLIEDELYSFETFDSLSIFFEKAYNYTRFFNCRRVNKYKKGTPLSILKEISSNIDENVLLFKPILLDNNVDYYKSYLKELAS